MIRWMITVLIRIAPNKTDENSPSDSNDDDSSGLGAAILMESSSASILDRATILFNWIRSLTDLVVVCCREIVISLIQPDATTDFKSPDQDYVRDLKKIEVSITLICPFVLFVFLDMVYFSVKFYIFSHPVLYIRQKKCSCFRRMTGKIFTRAAANLFFNQYSGYVLFFSVVSFTFFVFLCFFACLFVFSN